MFDFTFYALNLFMIFFLLAFLVIMIIKKSLNDFKGKLFTTLILAIIVMLTLEILSWVFDSKPGQTNYILNLVFNSLFTAFGTIIVSLWFSYIDYYKYGDRVKLRKMLYYMYPTIILIVLVIVNLFYPILFIISSDNVYQRLPLIYISISMSIIMYMYILIKVYQVRNSININTILGILIFLLFPLIAALIQLSYYGLMLMWPATAISLVLSFILIETTTKDIDFLTGAKSRQVAEERITYLLSKKKNFSVVMIDIDGFKELNDSFGHNIGDEALKTLSKALLKTFNKRDVVSRYGGDEFLIVTNEPLLRDGEITKIDIYNHFIKSDDKTIKQVKFSLGLVTIDSNNSLTKEEIMIKADDNMYLDKNKKENLNELP